MQIFGIYSRFGYTIEVFDDAGFSMEVEEFGNVEAKSTETVDPDDPQALPLQTLSELCEESAIEKAYLLGLSSGVVSVEFDPN